jgi:putative ATPase
VRTASEDIGTADPRALTLAMSAWDVQERLGSPEGELTLAQTVVYLAVAAKSNAVYKAWNEVRELVRETGTLEVPLHLRNAPTRLMKELDYGASYRYAHDEPHAFAAGEAYLPQQLAGRRFYDPSARGMEQKIREKLEYLQSLNQASSRKRYPGESGHSNG